VLFCVSWNQFLFVLFDLSVLRSVFLLQSQEIGWEERLRNDLYCVEWGAPSTEPCVCRETVERKVIGACLALLECLELQESRAPLDHRESKAGPVYR